MLETRSSIVTLQRNEREEVVQGAGNVPKNTLGRCLCRRLTGEGSQMAAQSGTILGDRPGNRCGRRIGEPKGVRCSRRERLEPFDSLIRFPAELQNRSR